MQLRILFALLAFTVGLHSTAGADEKASPLLWDLDRLSKAPKAEWGKKQDLVQEVYYVGEPFRGKPTRVFAYVGRPAKGDGPFPGMVLVHGGGGRAFADWARHWARRGYVAIAMDTAGQGPNGKPLADGGPSQTGTSKFREFTLQGAKDMWTFHAVSDVILAHSLLRSLPKVDRSRTGLTGISWGGYLTCLTAGMDQRFKVAVPVYGCGFLGDNSAWSKKQLAQLTPASRQLWLRLFDPSQYVGKTRCPILFLNGTNDFAYPLDSYRKTINLVDRNLVTVSIQVNLRHGHIWTFGEVDHFVDSVLKNAAPLINVGEVRVSGNVATAACNAKAAPAKAELHYATVIGNWPSKREWRSVAAEFAGGQLRATLPKERPLAIFFQVTDNRGLRTSSKHLEIANE